MKHIVLSEEITEAKAAEIIQEIVTPEEYNENNKPGKEEIYFYIDSCGGEVDSAVAIYNTLINCGKTITTIVIGRCESAGVLLLVAGHKRYAVENANFMIHKSGIEFDEKERYTEIELKNSLDEARRDDRKMFKIISSNSKISIPQIYKFIRESKTKNDDWNFGSIVAKKYGIIHYIGWPTPKY